MRKSHPVTLIKMINVKENISGDIYQNYSWEEYDDWEQDVLPFGGKVVFTFVICSLIIVCVIGNTLTIVSYFTDPKLQTVQNVYLVNLAFADLVVGLVSMPFYFITPMVDYHWIFGRYFCKFWNSVDFVVCLVSAYAIVLISVDRALMVWQCATYSIRQTKTKAMVRIVLSWCFAVLLYVPAILFWDVWRGYSIVKEGFCELEFYKNVPFTLSTAIFEFIVPFVSITTLSVYLYFSILKKSQVAIKTRLWQSSSAKSQASFHTMVRELEDKHKTHERESFKKSLTGCDTGETCVKERRILKRNKRAAKRLSILVGVFVTCWTPYTVTTIIIALCEDCIEDHLYEALIWLQWANSAINPFLYALTSPRFRQIYIRLLCLERRHKRQAADIEDVQEKGEHSMNSLHRVH